MSQETVAEKGRRLAQSGAVEVTYRGDDGIVAQVAGDSAAYRVVIDHDGEWCSCPSHHACSHLEALRLHLAERSEPDTKKDDPFTGLGPDESLRRGDAEQPIDGDAGTGDPGEATTTGPQTALAVPSEDRSLADLATAPVTWRTLEALSRTEFVPGALRGRPAAVLGAVLYGRDLGLGPLEALSLIDVIDGRPSPSAELMARKLREAGHTIEIVESTDSACELVGRRGDTGEEARVRYTLEDALRAGLIDRLDDDGRPVARSRNGKPLPWEQHPADMLWARAVSRIVRRLAPDCLTAPAPGDAIPVVEDGDSGPR